MPIYEYECTKCHNTQEVLQKFSDRPLTKCKHCSGKLQKLISQNSFHLKGSGWYVTDYAQKPRAPSPSKKKKEDASAAESKTSTAETQNSKKSADKTA
jgi:putative FmdB family regulatory protein